MRTKTLVFGPSGERTFTDYDLSGQILSLFSDNGNSTLHTWFTYTYDQSGMRVTVSDLNGSKTSFTYDAKGRLVRSLTTGANARDYTYTYDPNDNRLTDNELGSLRQSSYDAANRIQTSVTSGQVVTYSYEPNGNNTLVQYVSGSYTFTYSAYHWLSEAKRPDGTYKSFSYTAEGLLRTTSDSASSTVTTVVWDGQDYLQIRS